MKNTTANKTNKAKAIQSKKVAKKKTKKKLVKSKQKPKPIKAKAKKTKVVAVNKENKSVKQNPKSKIKPAAIIKMQKPNKAIKKAVSGEKSRYSEKELSQFRKIIVDKVEQAKKDHELLKITLSHTDDHGTDDTSHTFNSMEGSADGETKEETAQLALRQEKYIKNLQNALVRIENKTYGICRITGNLIPKERLLSVPHATLSMEAKQAEKFN